MSARSILLLAAALLLVVGTVFVAQAWLDSQRAPAPVAAMPAPKKDDSVRVLVAEVDLPAGTFIKEEHMRWQIWPTTSVPESYLLKSTTKPEDLYGAVIRRGIAAGEPITRQRIIKPGDRGFLAAVLKPGFRATSIKIGADSGVAGLIFPGDRVDIILTHTVKREDDSEHRASETVLKNVRVLALDSRVNDEDGKAKLAKTATLELTPKQVEVIAVARELGRLSLSLRALAKDEEELERLANSKTPLADPEPKAGKTYTWDSEASRLVGWPKSNENVVSVVRGNSEQNVTMGQMFDQMMKQNLGPPNLSKQPLSPTQTLAGSEQPQ